MIVRQKIRMLQQKLFILVQFHQYFNRSYFQQMIYLRILAIVCLPFVILTKSQYDTTGYICAASSCQFNLTYTGSEDYYGNPKNPIVKSLQVQLQAMSYYDLSIKIYDLNRARFQVPQGGQFPEDSQRNFSFPLSAAGFTFTYSLTPFYFQVTRKANNETIFSTYGLDLIFSEYFIQIGTQLTSDYIYGLGERMVNSFRIKDGKWTIFNRDRPFQIDTGVGKQTYGYYPYYLRRQKQNYFHINYFRSSNAMDIIKDASNGKQYLTYKVIGGVIDLRFMLSGENPIQLLQNFVQTYGLRPHIPPFWAMGFHQCRWGYQNVSMLQDVLRNYEQNDIPLDTIWSDIDYMLDFQDFTIDEQRFPIAQMLKITEKYRYIPIIDAGIKTVGPAYEEGLRRNLYVKKMNGQNYIGQVWPGNTTFIDFFNPNASKYWAQMLNILYKKLQFDGVWLDMNEVSNFCNGVCFKSEEQSIFDYQKDLPYTPGSDSIQSETISLNSTHYGGLKQADVHAFHAYLQTKATYQFFTEKKIRPFVLSRSSTIGSAKFGAHWTGDTSSKWQFLKGSIPNIFNSHLYGFSMIGQDICGFAGDTTVELCARWYQLGALYPFSRSHNMIATISQQPYALGPIVKAAATKAIKMRYSLLKHIYTFFILNPFKTNIWTPLFYYYPNNQMTYLDQIADTTFILTDILLVAPILEEGATTREMYFPENNWYDLYSGKRYQGNKSYIISSQLDGKIPIYIKSGTSILISDVQEVKRTSQLTNKFSIYSGLLTYQGRYRSAGVILTINDYEDAEKLDFCIKNYHLCTYNIVIQLYNNPKRIQIVISKSQGGFNDPILVEEFNLYYEDQIIRFRPQRPISFQKSETIVISLEESRQIRTE